MGIMWFKDDTKPGQATLYDSNITLNKVALKNFESSEAVQLGIDYQEKKVYIKPCGTGIANSFKISVAPSYGRITNKEFMKEIMRLLDVTLTNPMKFQTKWDSADGLLVIDLIGKDGN